MKYEDEMNEEYWKDIAEEKGEAIGVDTREGSIYMDAAMGHILRVTKFYSDLSQIYEMLSVSTSSGQLLREDAAMDGIYYYEATPSYWNAVFVGATPDVGSQFLCDDTYLTWLQYSEGVYYLRADPVLDEETGYYKAVNDLVVGAELIPVDNIDDLESATLGAVAHLGTDEESDDHLRSRWQDAKKGPSENGNKMHYKTWCESIEGIGRARIQPLWGGENTVRAVLYSSQGTNVSSQLVSAVQTYIDPIEDGYVVTVGGTSYTFGDGVGEGVGNLGAHFLAVSATATSIVVAASVVLKDGANLSTAITEATTKITAYLKNLVLEGSEDEDIVVRIASIGAIIEQMDSLVDYEYPSLTINSQRENITINESCVPVLTEVVFSVAE